MSRISKLYEKNNYLLEIPYITSTYITEYDLSKANISALKFMGRISDDEYTWLYNADKMYREIVIGNKCRVDNTLYKVIHYGILEAKKKLFEENRLSDNDVLSIKNDAVYVIGDKQLKSDFGVFNFKKKNVYTLFMSTTSKLEIYYSYDSLTGQEIIDVKGINDNTLYKHSHHLLSFLAQIFYMISNGTIEDSLKYFNEFYQNFIDLKLDVGYYREFNSDSIYRIKSNYQDFGFDFIDESYLYRDNNGKSIIDLNCNIMLLRDIHSLLSDIYFKSKNSSRG